MTSDSTVVVSSLVGGIVSGGIGALVANSSRSFPVLKGAIAVGLINTVIAGAWLAGNREPKQVGTSGLPLRFP